MLLPSNAIPEVANLCDRILVMYAGRVVAEMDGRTASEYEITTAMLGGGSLSGLQDMREHA